MGKGKERDKTPSIFLLTLNEKGNLTCPLYFWVKHLRVQGGSDNLSSSFLTEYFDASVPFSLCRYID